MPRGRSQVRFEFDSVDNASPGINMIGDSLERVGGEDGQSGLIGGLNIGFAAVGATAVAVGAALVANAGRWLEHTNQVRRSSEALNVNIEAYSELSYAFRQFGYDAVDIDSILAELEIKTFDWRDGNVAAADAFGELNLELEEFDRLAPDEKLDEVARALSDVESNSRRIGIADALLGGEDARILLDVAAGLDTLTDEAKRFGVTIDEESAETARKFQQNINTFEGFFEGAANRIGAATVNFIAPWVQEVGEIFGIIPDDAANSADGAIDVFTNSGLAAGAAGTTFGANLRDNIKGELDRIPTDVAEVLADVITITRNAQAAIQAISGISARDNLPAGSPASALEALLGGSAYGSLGISPGSGSETAGVLAPDSQLRGGLGPEFNALFQQQLSALQVQGQTDRYYGFSGDTYVPDSESIAGASLPAGRLAAVRDRRLAEAEAEAEAEAARLGGGSSAPGEVSPSAALQQLLAAISAEGDRPGVGADRVNALRLEYQRVQEELAYLQAGGNPDLYGIQAQEEGLP